LISELDKTPEVYNELLPLFDQGIAHYQNQDWDKAIELFTAADKMEDMFPGRNTNPSRVYIARCVNFKENPPGKDWNGVYRLTKK